MYAHFYLLGQNVAWLSVSWRASLFITSLIALVAGLASHFSDLSITALLFGWASVVYTVEFKMPVAAITYDCLGTVSTHYTGIIYGCELVLFMLMSILLMIDDGSLIIWVLTMVAHFIYVLAIYYVNKMSRRVISKNEVAAYYFYYMLILLSSDAFFFLISAIVRNRQQNAMSVWVLTAVTVAALYFTEDHQRRINNVLPQPSPHYDSASVTLTTEENAV